MDLRKAPRYAVDLAVFLYRDVNQDKQPIDMGKVVNLNEYGCKIESTLTVSQEETLALRIYIKGLHQQILIHSCSVIWVKEGCFGVNFRLIQNREKDRLAQVARLASTNGLIVSTEPEYA